MRFGVTIRGRAYVVLIWGDWDGTRVPFGFFTYKGHA